MDQLQQALEGRGELRTREAQHPVEAIVPVELSCANVPVVDTVVGSFHHQGVALLALAEPLFVLTQLRDGGFELRRALHDTPLEALVEAPDLLLCLPAL